MGKTCIHPSQVALANAVYQPTEAEIAYALKVVQAANTAEANAVGAYLVDGKMVDRPFVLRAQSILAAARTWGCWAHERAQQLSVNPGGWGRTVAAAPVRRAPLRSHSVKKFIHRRQP